MNFGWRIAPPIWTLSVKATNSNPPDSEGSPAGATPHSEAAEAASGVASAILDDVSKRGAQFFEQGRYEDASRLFWLALEQQETSERWHDWATARLACNRMADAERGLRRALELNPRNRLAGLKVGLLLANRNGHLEALPYLEQALPALHGPQRNELLQVLEETRRKAAIQVSERTSRYPQPEKTIGLDYDFLPAPRYGHGKPLHPELYRIIDRRREDFARFLGELRNLSSYFARIPNAPGASDDVTPYWGNAHFSGLDAMSLYGLLALRKPRRYVEIGSGNSTKFARRAVADHHLETRLISVDPTPRTAIDALCDQRIQSALESLDTRIFDSLEAGDVLFVDNSHRAFTNSDVTVFFLELLPRLKPGVLVHLHDIMLPADYPPEWAGRYYSEQYLLACYLLAEWPRLQIILANRFISLDDALMSIVADIYDKAGLGSPQGGGSFWMEMQ
jgi:tetratricopeptide (TPR) repeat protein